MDQRKAFIITGLVVLIILALIFLGVFYLTKTFQGGFFTNRSTPRPTITASPNSTAESVDTGSSGVAPPPAPGTPAPAQVGGLKPYSGQGFNFKYPANWGILRCNNSQNFELDPLNPQDSSIACNVAVKPVTVLVSGNTSCSGQVVKIGDISVQKSRNDVAGGVEYRWCTQTSPVLDITHRVSSSGGQATSPRDFSGQIEQMIGTFNTGSGGS